MKCFKPLNDLIDLYRQIRITDKNTYYNISLIPYLLHPQNPKARSVILLRNSSIAYRLLWLLFVCFNIWRKRINLQRLAVTQFLHCSRFKESIVNNIHSKKSTPRTDVPSTDPDIDKLWFISDFHVECKHRQVSKAVDRGISDKHSNYKSWFPSVFHRTCANNLWKFQIYLKLCYKWKSR